MAIRSVNIRELSGYVVGMCKDRHLAIVKAIQQTVQERGRVLVAQAIRETRPRPPFDRGTYQNSWKAINVPDGVKLVSSHPAASVIENGRRPGFGVSRAGIEALKGWAKRHGMDNPLSAAFAIATAIRKHVLPAKYVLERAGDALTKEVRQAAHNAAAGGTL
jgi:hypothetical protein